MKTNKPTLSVILFSLAMVIKSFAASPITFEHSFDGYYYPYNFPLYQTSDDDHYFYSPTITSSDGKISLITYNEDYSIRDNYQVYFDIPDGYKVQSIAFSSSLKLADGTPFFIVSFTSTTIPYGGNRYAIAKIYNARTGASITDLGHGTMMISFLNGVWEINGKPSILVIIYDYDTNTNTSTQRTDVYSLGTPQSNSIEEPEGAFRCPEPIRIYDINGRGINQPIPGQPFVGIMSDGQSKVMINN